MIKEAGCQWISSWKCLIRAIRVSLLSGEWWIGPETASLYTEAIFLGWLFPYQSLTRQKWGLSLISLILRSLTMVMPFDSENTRLPLTQSSTNVTQNTANGIGACFAPKRDHSGQVSADCEFYVVCAKLISV